MKLFNSALVVAVLLSGCATSPEETQTTEDTVYIGFTEASNGTMTQKIRGFSCPAELNGLYLTRAELLNDDGSDAFCNYVDDNDRIFTVYLSDFPEMDLITYFEWSMQDTGNATEKAGYIIDEDLSKTCENSSVDGAALLKGLANMKDNEVFIGTDPAVVFRNSEKLSILSLKEVQEGQFLKFRYSLPGSSEEDTKLACDFITERSLTHDKEIKLATGYEFSEQEKMWDVLDLLATDSDNK